MTIPLILFAKTPEAGKVKTRLQTHCSADQAAEIAVVLMTETIARATQFWPGRVVLAVWPDLEHPLLKDLVEKYGLSHMVQADGDLGFKMKHALELAGFPAAVMGCDVPHCSEQIYREAYQQLLEGQAVIGPANDGGYYLLGLPRQEATLFEDIQWGGSDVLQDTQAKAVQADVQLRNLPTLDDVDRWADVLAIAPQVPALQRLLCDFDLEF